jgi:uncharacterized OB-fold protein
VIVAVQTELTAPYWAAAREGVVLLQRCGDCGQLWHPPAPVCLHCRSRSWTWLPAAGTGQLRSVTEVVHPVHPQVAAEVPYLLALVQLSEGPLFLCGLAAPGEQAALVDGAAVTIERGTAVGGQSLPMARLG